MRTKAEIEADIAEYEEKQKHLAKNQSFVSVLRDLYREMRLLLTADIPLPELEAMCQAWQERDKGCEYCMDNSWDGMEFTPKYCPRCGRRLAP